MADWWRKSAEPLLRDDQIREIDRIVERATFAPLPVFVRMLLTTAAGQHSLRAVVYQRSPCPQAEPLIKQPTEERIESA